VENPIGALNAYALNNLTQKITDSCERERALCALVARRDPVEAVARVRAIGIAALRVSALRSRRWWP
jgi:hypothetical protein